MDIKTYLIPMKCKNAKVHSNPKGSSWWFSGRAIASIAEGCYSNSRPRPVKRSIAKRLAMGVNVTGSE